ncbi:Protein PHR1-LIKE 1 [Camellia lanceoleosa]|uniref:Protein PHR1-LIKE 1 n=1 Tax=Camellia lanceoleosa TaxID=1840588 RepID=A0ACC0IDP0_9ERIC|nr:Protein PHR1-LIKE 1 [Camellia lanceoleosa]
MCIEEKVPKKENQQANIEKITILETLPREERKKSTQVTGEFGLVGDDCARESLYAAQIMSMEKGKQGISSRKRANSDNDDIRSERRSYLEISNSKGLKSMEDHSERKNAGNSSTEKKSRMKWTPALQFKFMEAISTVGDERAHPKVVHEMMNEPELTVCNVASHLQKYREHVNRMNCEIDAQQQLEQQNSMVHTQGLQASNSEIGAAATTTQRLNVGTSSVHYNLEIIQQALNPSNSIGVEVPNKTDELRGLNKLSIDGPNANQMDKQLLGFGGSTENFSSELACFLDLEDIYQSMKVLPDVQKLLYDDQELNSPYNLQSPNSLQVLPDRAHEFNSPYNLESHNSLEVLLGVDKQPLEHARELNAPYNLQSPKSLEVLPDVRPKQRDRVQDLNAPYNLQSPNSLEVLLGVDKQPLEHARELNAPYNLQSPKSLEVLPDVRPKQRDRVQDLNAPYNLQSPNSLEVLPSVYKQLDHAREFNTPYNFQKGPPNVYHNHARELNAPYYRHHPYSSEVVHDMHQKLDHAREFNAPYNFQKVPPNVYQNHARELNAPYYRHRPYSSEVVHDMYQKLDHARESNAPYNFQKVPPNVYQNHARELNAPYYRHRPYSSEMVHDMYQKLDHAQKLNATNYLQIPNRFSVAFLQSTQKTSFLQGQTSSSSNSHPDLTNNFQATNQDSNAVVGTAAPASSGHLGRRSTSFDDLQKLFEDDKEIAELNNGKFFEWLGIPPASDNAFP